MLQFLCTSGSDDEEDKEDLIKFEAMSINISDSCGGGYDASVVLVSI